MGHYVFFQNLTGTRWGATHRPSATRRNSAPDSGDSNVYTLGRFVCPECGDRSAFATDCVRCEVPLEAERLTPKDDLPEAA